MGASARLTDHCIVLFDGVCNLCTSSVQFIINRDPAGIFRFASLQSAYAQGALKQHGISTSPDDLFSIILLANGKIYSRSDAALEIARYLSGWWPALRVFKIVPRFIRDAVYNWISLNRYKIFGKKEACMIPDPELKMRFLE